MPLESVVPLVQVCVFEPPSVIVNVTARPRIPVPGLSDSPRFAVKRDQVVVVDRSIGPVYVSVVDRALLTVKPTGPVELPA